MGYQTISLDHQYDDSRSEIILKPIILTRGQQEIDEIEVLGERNRKPKGLVMITRMPLKPSDQIQLYEPKFSLLILSKLN